MFGWGNTPPKQNFYSLGNTIKTVTLPTFLSGKIDAFLLKQWIQTQMHSKATGSKSHQVMNLCLSDEYTVKSQTWDSDLKYAQGWEKSIINVYLIYFTLCKLPETWPLELLAERSAQVHPGPIDMLSRFDIRMIRYGIFNIY